MAVNMAVVVPSGVVGFITDVYPHSARVQTILDPVSYTHLDVYKRQLMIQMRSASGCSCAKVCN